eukprot:SAG31_NODE_426_length_15814_cov_25.737066_10_plen_76_part_00
MHKQRHSEDAHSQANQLSSTKKVSQPLLNESVLCDYQKRAHLLDVVGEHGIVSHCQGIGLIYGILDLPAAVGCSD